MSVIHIYAYKNSPFLLTYAYRYFRYFDFVSSLKKRNPKRNISIERTLPKTCARRTSCRGENGFNREVVTKVCGDSAADSSTEPTTAGSILTEKVWIAIVYREYAMTIV